MSKSDTGYINTDNNGRFLLLVSNNTTKKITLYGPFEVYEEASDFAKIHGVPLHVSN